MSLSFSNLLNVCQLDVVFGLVVLGSDEELDELLFSFDELRSCFAIDYVFCQMLHNDWINVIVLI